MTSQDLLSTILDESGISPEIEVIDLTDSPKIDSVDNDDSVIEVIREYKENNEKPKQKIRTLSDWLVKDNDSGSKTPEPDIEVLAVHRSPQVNNNFLHSESVQILKPLSSYSMDNAKNSSFVPYQAKSSLLPYQAESSLLSFQKGSSMAENLKNGRFAKRKRSKCGKRKFIPPSLNTAPFPNFSLPLMSAQQLPNLFNRNTQLGSGSQNPVLYPFQRNFSPFTSLFDTNASFIQNTMVNNILASENGETGEEEEEELGCDETYADYMPSKLKIGEKHPDPVVESSSLSSVPPPDVWYKVSVPEDVIDNGQLSALQLEAVTYACQQHEIFLPDGCRAGFLIGDGAGVGKGRTLAGIIYENYLCGRKKSIWLSVSNDLKYDSERDLKDIGAKKIQVHSLNKFKYAKISSKENGSFKKGVIFATYSSLISESQSGGKFNSRLKQLLNWCGEDFDGCIVFDECHKAKNLCPVGSKKPTKTGVTVLELQNKLPKARVVYASATGASEPKNMAYMNRLGIWGKGTPFKEFSDFIAVVEKRGVGAMELVAMDMKLRGLYIARQLSFSGVTFKVEEIPLHEKFINMYNKSADLWVEAREKFSDAADIMDADKKLKMMMWAQFWAAHQRFFKYLCIAAKVSRVVELAREAVKNAKCAVIGLQSTGEARTLEQLEEQGELSDFVSTAKGVFQSLIEKHFPAADHNKTLKCLSLASSSSTKFDYGKDGSTFRIPTASGECKKRKTKNPVYYNILSSDDNCSSGEDSDFVLYSNVNSSADSESISSSLKSKSSDESDSNLFANETGYEYPWAVQNMKSRNQKRKKVSKSSSKSKNVKYEYPPSSYAAQRTSEMKKELLNKLEELSSSLPSNTLDQLIDDLGGPELVAEMTGRKGRVVNNRGKVQYESRSESDVSLEALNMTEKQRFMDGEKQIAIISEAASSGISLQSDRRVSNKARRVHITLELPWSADRAIQQFGRTHRSNQVNAPEYVFLISDLAGERRFASIVSKRLESLGALTHGDRRATETRDLSMFNFDTKYGRIALERVMQSIAGHESPMIPPPENYRGNFFLDVQEALSGVGIIRKSAYEDGVILEKDYNNISKFLNRILGIHVELQNKLFKYFTDTLNAIIQEEKKNGRYDLGILDLGSGGAAVKRIKYLSFMSTHSTGKAKIELNTVLVERGLSWENVVEKWHELGDKDEGFYLSGQVRNNRKTAVLIAVDNSRSGVAKKDKEKYFRIYRPNTGLLPKRETLDEIKSRYRKCTKMEVERHWKENYNASKTECSHVYWFGRCGKKIVGLSCEVGLRERTYYVLSGSVLSVWPKIESVLSNYTSSRNAKLQIVRLITEEGERIVGCLIPNCAINELTNVLKEANDVTENDFD